LPASDTLQKCGCSWLNFPRSIALPVVGKQNKNIPWPPWAIAPSNGFTVVSAKINSLVDIPKIMQPILEPEVMDTGQEAVEYDGMDFSVVNNAFAIEAIALAPAGGVMLDTGTGTARIPIRIAQFAPQWQIQGIDLAENMLQIGRRNVEQAGLQLNISLNRDCKLVCVKGQNTI
jgi:ubiE/COQ5 methyltransferase family